MVLSKSRAWARLIDKSEANTFSKSSDKSKDSYKSRARPSILVKSKAGASSDKKRGRAKKSKALRLATLFIEPLELRVTCSNQSKISRLIRKLDAIKSKNEFGQIVYRLGREPAPPTTTTQLSNLIIDVVANETIIIVNTSPGAAQLIARVLDYHKDKIQIIGTIAGDDSIFIAPASIKMINDSLREIKNLLFLLFKAW